MRELLRLFVPRVAKANCVREPLDVGVVSCQKMPARVAARPVVPGDVSCLLCGCNRRRVFRVKADGHDFKVFSDIERVLPKRSEHPVHHLITKHRTGVIDERDHYRLAFEKLPKPNFLTLLIFEYRIQRKLIIKLLIDADFFQHRRQSG